MHIKDYMDLAKAEKMEKESKSLVPWSHEVVKTAHRIGKLNSESPLKQWFDEEDTKRRAKLKNEIDIAEIMTAFRGTKNKWSKRVQNNPDAFKPILENKSYDWEVILNVKEI